MRFKNFCGLIGLLLLGTVFSNQTAAAQQQTKKISAVTDKSATTAKTTATTIKTVAASAAYAEVYAAKVETEADLKVLTLDSTEESPLVKAKKYEQDFLLRAIRWLEVLPAESAPKMTAALGKLLVRKAQAEANLKFLQETYADEHPLVKKARARFTVYSDEIEKLLAVSS